MGKNQIFQNFTANGETIDIDWSAARKTNYGMDIPAVIHVGAGSGGFRFGISLSVEVALDFAVALVEAAHSAQRAAMVDEGVTA